MSILIDALQGVTARVLWRGADVELVALGKEAPRGAPGEEWFEVHIPGEAVLYRSESRSAAFYYLEMLLASVGTPLAIKD